MKWIKAAPDRWECKVPPDARFLLTATAKADGRWTWQVFKADARNAMASGIVSTPGDAKHAMEQFMKRAGLV